VQARKRNYLPGTISIYPTFQLVKQDGKWGFSMFMSEVIQEFGFDCKIRKLSPKTIANYQKQMKYLQRYLENGFGVKEVEAIQSVHIKQLAKRVKLQLSALDKKELQRTYILSVVTAWKEKNNSRLNTSEAFSY